MAARRKTSPRKSREATVASDAAAVAGAAGAAGHEAAGTDAEITHGDSRTTRDRGFDTQMTRENADINIEEQGALHGMQQSHAWDANSKRTYDWHQTLDSDALHAARQHAADLQSLQIRSAEATLLHQSKINSLEIAERQQDHAQRVRFADANSTVQITVLADMAKAVSDSSAACAAACAALAKK